VFQLLPKGGDLALTMATTQGSNVKAAVWINGCLGSGGGEITKKGQTLFPAIGLRPDFRPKLREDGTLNVFGALEEVTKDSAIPVERAQAELLMIAGEDDWNSDSVRYAQMAADRCSQARRSHLRIETLPDLGHIVELPFAPVPTALRHPMLPRGSPPVYMGGGPDLARTGRAQAKATNIYTAFLQEKLKL